MNVVGFMRIEFAHHAITAAFTSPTAVRSHNFVISRTGIKVLKVFAPCKSFLMHKTHLKSISLSP